jgi:hypothetical protein
VTEFTIERSTLVPGAEPEDLDGHVLGQFLKACGAEDPAHTPAETALWEPLQYVYDSYGYSMFESIAIHSEALVKNVVPPRYVVEGWVIDHFKKAGITATFIGEYTA